MQWFYAINGQQNGPVDFSVIQSLYDAGTLTADTLVWRQGTPEWVRLSTVAEQENQPVVSSAPPEIIVEVPKTNWLAATSLILAILGLFCCGLILGGAAAVIGHLALNRIKMIRHSVEQI